MGWGNEEVPRNGSVVKEQKGRVDSIRDIEDVTQQKVSRGTPSEEEEQRIIRTFNINPPLREHGTQHDA